MRTLLKTLLLALLIVLATIRPVSAQSPISAHDVLDIVKQSKGKIISMKLQTSGTLQGKCVVHVKWSSQDTTLPIAGTSQAVLADMFGITVMDLIAMTDTIYNSGTSLIVDFVLDAAVCTTPIGTPKPDLQPAYVTVPTNAPMPVSVRLLIGGLVCTLAFILIRGKKSQQTPVYG